MGYSFTFKFSEKDIDFSPRSGYFFNYHKFLINEFFNSTDDEMLNIMQVYQRSFGDSAYKYVMKTYYMDWRHGNRTLSNVQEGRILYIMPALLNEQAKKNLNTIKEQARYKLGVEEVVGGIKRIVQSFFKNQLTIYSEDNIQTADDIQAVFQKEIIRAKCLKIVGTFYVLDENERVEVVEISKYIVYIKLQKQFEQIEKDFNTFMPFMKIVNRGVFSATYNLTAFNFTIDFTKKVFDEIKFPCILVDEIVADSRFKEFSDKYLANELVTINTDANRAVSSAFLNAYDIKLFFDHYRELSNTESEVNMKSSFIGESGNLKIQIIMKPIKMLKTSIAKSLSKISIYTIIAAGLLTIIIGNKWYSILFLGGIFILGFYINVISEEIKRIKDFKAEIKQYGQ